MCVKRSENQQEIRNPNVEIRKSQNQLGLRFWLASFYSSWRAVQQLRFRIEI